tara:strand:+ start:4709 stop:5242 length:534 start_codon:yes stop_codon:yes gene_type:complete
MVSNMQIETAAAWAEILGLITILGAAIYSWFQIKELKKARQSAAALSLAELFQSPEFAGGLYIVSYQPENLNNLDEFKEYHGEKWQEAFAVMTTWESLGALVFRGDVKFKLVYDLFSGLIQHHHKLCLKLIDSDRKNGGDTRFEWFTWLAERLEEFDDGGAAPQAAHLEYKDWKPFV